MSKKYLVTLSLSDYEIELIADNEFDAKQTAIDIFEDDDGEIIIRPTVSSSKIPGQVDYRDMVPDKDGVYPEDEV
jgi:hypothetical protein